MRPLYLFLFLVFVSISSGAQTPKSYTSSEILLQLKKLNVLGSVLYIAAHPDDENTRLLAYLANEKLYRTGYLSLTRGDGGQNLIGDEQGIDLGLIRTQELLAARRIDGAEQFFSRAYDFGFCKTSEEALATWGHDKTLSDVVWVIRKFKPDVIIARFPEDSRAGHGHHAASGILAREAFDAAADPTKFPEQLKQGVTVWQAKRMMWNTFNFGSTNTQNESQFKLDVGAFNPLLGKSYGEIAALSRSQHKSQGFGVPAQRGTVNEYFETIKGEKPVNDLVDGVDLSWGRLGTKEKQFSGFVDEIIRKYDPANPARSIQGLVAMYKSLSGIGDSYWKQQKLKELQTVIENCSGLFMEATTGSQYAVVGDSLKVTATINNRSGITLKNAAVNMYDDWRAFDTVKVNSNKNINLSIFIRPDQKITQPYWLEKKMEKGSFNVTDQHLIGKAENEPISITFEITIDGVDLKFKRPIRYKYTDPVKGEIYQPVYFTPGFAVKFLPELDVITNDHGPSSLYSYITSFKDNNKVQIFIKSEGKTTGMNAAFLLNKESAVKDTLCCIDRIPAYDSTGKKIKDSNDFLDDKFSYESGDELKEVTNIRYDHIPQITYFKKSKPTKIVDGGIKTIGHLIGYIPGAGDKVPQALEEMGYKVIFLKEQDITLDNLRQFDAVVTGVRAYNTNEWMNNVYDALMGYVKEGGVMLVQYNTSNQIGPVKAKIAPYPFNISRNRVTDETAKVNFLLPGHPALNYPNKITETDFEGWIQERSIYNTEKIDSNYQRILSMKDPGENEQDGSLIIADYGKGKFVYTGLVFFRELPAGVPGAYRLFANLIAAPSKSSPTGETLKTPQSNDSKLSGKSEAQ